MTKVGRVSANREALVPTLVRVPKGAGCEVNVLLRAGFSGYLALLGHMTDELRFQRLGREQFTLASGETALVGKLIGGQA